jgi:hypothetical protein
MNELKEIQEYWENNIYKEAGTVSVFFDKLVNGFKVVKDSAKDAILKPSIAALPITAILAASAYNKIKSPTIVSKNMDKRLLLNALDTEIAFARRQIAEIEARKATDTKNKPYDRFI